MAGRYKYDNQSESGLIVGRRILAYLSQNRRRSRASETVPYQCLIFDVSFK